MDDYASLPFEHNQTISFFFILHVGTNDLILNTPPDEIARKVVHIAEKAEKLKPEKCDVKFQKLVLKTDQPDLDKKWN